MEFKKFLLAQSSLPSKKTTTTTTKVEERKIKHKIKSTVERGT